ncbi:uncharacterized protein LOC143222902 [Tachypleus tridentatus]|uniref:uncharacterized protein LOC143222902 n=1 Tax=Tachypleus tridentatus TaxID=6853 RepID=UPI003FD52E71
MYKHRNKPLSDGRGRTKVCHRRVGGFSITLCGCVERPVQRIEVAENVTQKAISGLCKIHQKYHQRHLLQGRCQQNKQERKTEKSAKVEKIMLFSHVLRKKKRKFSRPE